MPQLPNKGRLTYALPTPEEYLSIIMASIHRDLRAGTAVVVRQPPLMERAATLVNEIGVLAYQDYNIDVEFVESLEE